jgi:hypothetical protein
MYATSDYTWEEMPKYSATDYNGAWEAGPVQYVSAFNLTPANSRGDGNLGGVARVWVARRRGTIGIRGHVLRSDVRAGSGVYAVINLVSGRNVTQVWPPVGGKQLIEGTDEVGYSTDVSNISVLAGDTIRFEITANGDSSNDTTSWTPSVGYVSPTVLKCQGFDSAERRNGLTQTGRSRMIGDCQK